MKNPSSFDPTPVFNINHPLQSTGGNLQETGNAHTYVNIYIYMCVCMHTYIYIYIYTCTHKCVFNPTPKLQSNDLSRG